MGAAEDQIAEVYALIDRLQEQTTRLRESIDMAIQTLQERGRDDHD